MKTYLKRLGNHPGVPVASMLTVLFSVASWPQWYVGFACSLVFWFIVLITAWTQPLPKEGER